ncbi:hypothetical protein [Campylobacter hyointestinalis]|uniref:Uncharacterized protein n=1 Tax=Campylobacter hyointestinalis subsp. lawsonii TaxID=91353 RepID=A0AAV6EH96_CAMHY|nr:hypothetical protein [Campylobacter hyointestinalis]ANE32025.1 hypothetical protein CHH_0318 [Campylobacter hyointestinalis subsp. hyointestinalis LMG 9260]KAB0614233.1 hypothetical protein F7P66_01185 [Campylobacter hyointestinalis subsp. lawsonii]KEA44463.1 hypothetical protein CR67_04170 [Campylobacter hyointestinalis subsp. hyointestinalis]QKF55189.1 hypothetical protein CHHT_0316 [Campylobacter hyointestinalis subsp. hyointestinalis]QKF69979.1 hypothetical protein CHLWT_1439 [Campyloba
MHYDEFKPSDLNLILIAQNAKKFGIDFMSNPRTLELLFSKKQTKIAQPNLEALSHIFEVLERIKQNSQLSNKP